MIARRNMLMGIFAAASAPAVVRASSMMKIWVPPEPKLILFPMEIGRIEGFRFIQEPFVFDNEGTLSGEIVHIDGSRFIQSPYAGRRFVEKFIYTT